MPLPGAPVRSIAALIAATQLAGCTLVQLHQESKEFYSATVLVGRVAAPGDWQGPVIVAATTRTDGELVVAHQVLLHEPGGYELIVPDGRYTLVAFGDRNGDGLVGQQDPVAMLSSPVEVSGAGIVTLLDLSLAYGEVQAVRDQLPSRSTAPKHSTQVGAIADLEAPAFSAQSGSEGYWAPLDSFRRIGGNVYFLEPYDPARTPVVFVHGASGSAQDWRDFFDGLDRTRYQAWFFQYPSGASLDSMAHLFYWKLLNLQIRYGFQRVHIVAHSMGGLVVRRFVLNHGEQFPQLGQFVSISTPWGGESAAAVGVKHSPAVVPSWRDMQPDGAFLNALFERPLPAPSSHTLLFSHRGGYNLMRPNTDGVVTLASQLRPDAQAQARLVMGFDEDHVSILSAREVIDQVQQVLDGDVGVRAGAEGRISVRVSSERPIDAMTDMTLILMRVDAPDAQSSKPRLLPVSASKEAIGPIAPGVYDARLLVPAFRPVPDRQRITVDSVGTAVVDFQIVPQGVLAGFVAADGDSIAYPAGSFRPPHSSVRIQRITLDGPGGQRLLVPRAEKMPELLATHLENRDDAAGPSFAFVNLIEGDYLLTIEAEGYERHQSRYRVVPGRVNPSIPIVLEPR